MSSVSDSKVCSVRRYRDSLSTLCCRLTLVLLDVCRYFFNKSCWGISPRFAAASHFKTLIDNRCSPNLFRWITRDPGLFHDLHWAPVPARTQTKAMIQSDAITAIARWLTSIDRSKRRIRLSQQRRPPLRRRFTRIARRIRSTWKPPASMASVIQNEDRDHHRDRQTASRVFMWVKFILCCHNRLRIYEYLCG